MKKIKLWLYIFLLFFSTQTAFGADIFLGLDKSEVKVNDTFSATIYINTSGTVINSAEGIIAFPNDLLSVESVSMSSSVFSIWVEQPSFSNNTGTISFNGGAPNPGFNGARGAVVRVTFKAKEKGSASLTFNSANIYANDGLGTDVTSSKKGTTVNIGDQAVVPPPSTVNTPSAPEITSLEMPTIEKWYSQNRAVFTWDVGNRITSTQLLVNTSSNSIPTITYTPPIGNKEITNIPEGISYIHVRLANANGWGATAHRKIKVDTVPPTDLNATSLSTDDDYIKLTLTAKDKTSGVQSYKVLFEGGMLGSVQASQGGSTEFILPAIPFGTQELSLYAYDQAGNSTTRNVFVESPQIKAPRITKHSEVISKGDRIEVAGTTYVLGDVLVFIKEEGVDAKSYVVKADENGNFVFTSDSVDTVGMASVWAVASRGEKVQSDASASVYVKVNKSFVVRTGLWATEVLIVLIPLILLLILLICLIYYGFHTFRMMRRKLLLDLDKTEDESRKIFEIIKDDVKKSVQLFKKVNGRRKVSDEEREVLETLTKDIEQAEEYFEKRIEKIEKDDL